MTAGAIVIINGEHYRLRGRDLGQIHPEDKGLWRAEKVKANENGYWYVCDDDDWMITDDLRVVAREVGWRLMRFDV